MQPSVADTCAPKGLLTTSAANAKTWNAFVSLAPFV